MGPEVVALRGGRLTEDGFRGQHGHSRRAKTASARSEAGSGRSAPDDQPAAEGQLPQRGAG